MKQANEPKQWTLMADDVTLGTLTLYEPDFPWLYCHFTPTPAFESVQPLFEAEQTALEEGTGDQGVDQWEQAYAAVDALNLRLVGADGQSIDELLLHIVGDQAWFRY